jgi:hypothetical protein
MYEVHLACRDHCEYWEAERVMLETDNADRAIQEAELLRDNDHETWITKSA